MVCGLGKCAVRNEVWKSSVMDGGDGEGDRKLDIQPSWLPIDAACSSPLARNFCQMASWSD